MCRTGEELEYYSQMIHKYLSFFPLHTFNNDAESFMGMLHFRELISSKLLRRNGKGREP
jgi:hypothetical protein